MTLQVSSTDEDDLNAHEMGYGSDVDDSDGGLDAACAALDDITGIYLYVLLIFF